MLKLSISNEMRKKNISRYKLQQITNWNYKRINALYFNRIKYISLEELDTLINIFQCKIQDIIN